MLLDHHDLPAADLSSLQCLWYGAAPMSASRLAEALNTIGPVMGQLFGQSEAPMMISTDPDLPSVLVVITTRTDEGAFPQRYRSPIRKASAHISPPMRGRRSRRSATP